MKKIALTLATVALFFPNALRAQSPEVKFIADTLVIQAEGRYEADPDLATLSFSVFAQDKNLKQTYDQARVGFIPAFCLNDKRVGEGRYEADPDLATLSFSVFAQDKNLKQTYDQASQSMQKIASVAEKNGLKKEDVTFGVLTVRPYYEGDKKKRVKSYVVQGQIALKVRDFSKLGPLLEDSVEDGITDFRSLTYSLADEEAARQHAAAAAMRSAMGRAAAVLE